MGKKVTDPRYNVVCTRLADWTYFEMLGALAGRSIAEYLAAAVEEKVTRDRQQDLDEHLRAAGL